MEMGTTYIKKKSLKQERRTAKEFNGRTTPASGALSGAKGDVRTGVRTGATFNQQDFLIENKFTDKSYYPLKLDIWNKIEKEALRDNFRTPLMQIDIEDYSIVVISKNDLYNLVDTSDFKISETMETTKKSVRLSHEDIWEKLRHTHGINLVFKTGSKKKELVIMDKDRFIEL